MSAPASLADWLGVELQKKLDSLPTDQSRYETLTRQRNVWIRRRETFMETFGASEVPHPVYGRLTAADFIVVIADIDAQKSKLERAPA